MRKIIALFWVCQTFNYGCSEIESTKKTVSISSWNEQTLKCLRNKIENSNDSLSKSLYTNRFINWERIVEDSSDRYRRGQFIKYIEASSGDNFVIELIRSGNRVSIINTILKVVDKNKVQRFTYTWSHNGWVLLNKEIIAKQGLINLDELLNCHAVFGKGDNSGDIIVTKFNALKQVEKNEYYIIGLYNGCFSEMISPGLN